ncbi:zinc finger protein ZAT4-like [Juglans microcarpa x Juglans regia]|uniref:zinc finger protein ZAT4-like n=1 Tax=Juglans microcarpa x Juglans regia TaxID=2249226 RepID=UPI001B7DAD51|nr:zinc finger protein ZAT4-like [Juglans microcarpa x Juglans regia]
MEKHRICKICTKRLANGKAMGGHMRSHLAKLPIPPTVQQLDNSFAADSTLLSPSQSSSSSLNFPSPMQSYRSLNRDVLSLVPNSDKESDADSQPMNPTRRISKRRRETFAPLVKSPLEPELVSSVSDTFFEEDVAMSLLMLSRGKWPRTKEEVQHEGKDIGDDHSLRLNHTRTRPRTKFKCQTCKKAFPSYQALGGHRANHKKTKNQSREEDLEDGKDGGTARGRSRTGHGRFEQRVFECEFCFKVFESGQALGGHKKVHFSNLGNARSSSVVRFGDNIIDLNQPAQMEEDDEASQLVDFISTVSDAE